MDSVKIRQFETNFNETIKKKNSRKNPHRKISSRDASNKYCK